MMGRSPPCHFQSFVEISLPVPEKIFDGVFGHGGRHLGHVIALYQQIFISMYRKVYIQNLIENGPVVSEKRKF